MCIYNIIREFFKKGEIMEIDQNAFNQIAITLSNHFDSLYYVEIETGNFKEIISPTLFGDLKVPDEGTDFFEVSRKNASKYVHPDDLDMILELHTKEVIIEKLSNNDNYSVASRLIINGEVIHIRHINIMCKDRKHILCCLEDINKEVLEKEEQQKNLESAQRMARRDELTGIKNKNAFTEYVEELNRKIKEKKVDCFAVVMCDVNNLKLINDTRGHSFGDEAIQKTSRMICDIYKHSPVFRIGGDEFVVVLIGSDYDNREQLLTILRKESNTNARFRSGPVVATGMGFFEPKNDADFSSVFERADKQMYENKQILKSNSLIKNFRDMDKLDIPITDERKRILDSLFDALYTVSGGGYVYLNDMKFDYSRWSLPLIDDFGLSSEYMYHAETTWIEYVHPEDKDVYKEAVDAVLKGNAEIRHIYYRVRKPDGTYVSLTTRGFVLTDSKGNPDYFGGIIIPQ